MALDLLDLGEGSVGFLNAALGDRGAGRRCRPSMLLDRGRLASGSPSAALIVGLATALPGLWPVAVAAYAGWLGDRPRLHGRRGRGEDPAAAPRLRRDPGRCSARSSRPAWRRWRSARSAPRLWSSCSGSGGAAGARRRCCPPSWCSAGPGCAAFEVGAPVAEEHFQLLRGNSIFAPLPVATLERISHDLVAVDAAPGEEVITQGDPGDRFYLIEDGEVEVFEDGVFRRNEGRGEASARSPCCATCRAPRPFAPTPRTGCWRSSATQFIAAVTGHQRSHQSAEAVAEGWLAWLGRNSSQERGFRESEADCRRRSKEGTIASMRIPGICPCSAERLRARLPRAPRLGAAVERNPALGRIDDALWRLLPLPVSLRRRRQQRHPGQLR